MNYRWFDDNYHDSVKPLNRVSNTFYPPSKFQNVILFPIKYLFSYVVFPIAATLLKVEMMLTPKNDQLRVQDRASKTALAVARFRDILYRSGIGSDNLACIFMPNILTKLVNGIVSLFPKYTGEFFDYGYIRVSLVNLTIKVYFRFLVLLSPIIILINFFI